MTRHGLVFAAVFLLSGLAFGSNHLTSTDRGSHHRITTSGIPDFDLEMTSREIQNVLAHSGTLLTFHNEDDAQLQLIMDAGKRNLDWLEYINQFRDEAHKISLSSAATQSGIPIDHPVTYNPDLIRKKFDGLMLKVPDAIKSVVMGKGAFPKNPPLTDDEYVTWCRQIDSSYQMASRWFMMEPYLDQLALRQNEDVRGYYDLSRNPDAENELRNWHRLPIPIQTQYSRDLLEICMNNNVDTCQAELDAAIQNNTAVDFYDKYIGGAKQVWDGFFTIQASRGDLIWKNNPEELHVPFTNPQDAQVQKFLSYNIQDEWHWGPWHLLLDFVTGDPMTTHVVFVPGATPHVNDLAGSEITLDANQPLTEYNVQWTIRHEFGHVLGFPDCYVEFYDQSQQAMVDYQLDVTNLMCSRQGHLQEKHYTELKRVYGSH